MERGEATPTGRRATRAALAEIPLELDRLRVTHQPLTPVTNTAAAALDLRSPPAAYLGPAPSPDELVIQERGRRRLPVTWSPDIEYKRNSTFHSAIRTPPKSQRSPARPHPVGVTLRSTPRKRLLMGDADTVLTPEKVDSGEASVPGESRTRSPSKASSPSVKRLRMERRAAAVGAGAEGGAEPALALALKGLSAAQLAEVVRGLARRHPELESEIRAELPQPDLRPLEDRLNYLKGNIYRSLPASRLTSKTDSPAYSRVATHLAAFKKCVLEQGATLAESARWDSVLEYALLAWAYVRATPLWDNAPHNAPRRHCFKALAAHCLTALRRGAWDREQLRSACERLRALAADSDDLRACVEYAQARLDALPVCSCAPSQ